MTKFKQSLQLFRASIAITLRYRKLLWFPILTMILTGLIALFFLSAMALPAILHPTGYHLNQRQHWAALNAYYFSTHAVKPSPNDPAVTAKETPGSLSTGHSAAANLFGNPTITHSSPLVSLPLLLLYCLSMFLATFFNVAFYNEIIEALSGRGVSFRRGLSVARSRWPSILAWSLLAGAVGWVIRSIEERLPFAARIVTGLIGMVWSVAAVFAIPVIIQEQSMRNPLKILHQSALTLKQTWGEGLLGYLGFSAGSVVIFTISLLPLLLAGGVSLLLKSVWVIALAGVIWMLSMFFIAYVSSVASHVYRCALYIYAAEGMVVEPYNQDLLNMAWKVKKHSE